MPVVAADPEGIVGGSGPGSNSVAFGHSVTVALVARDSKGAGAGLGCSESLVSVEIVDRAFVGDSLFLFVATRLNSKAGN